MGCSARRRPVASSVRPRSLVWDIRHRPVPQGRRPAVLLRNIRGDVYHRCQSDAAPSDSDDDCRCGDVGRPLLRHLDDQRSRERIVRSCGDGARRRAGPCRSRRAIVDVQYRTRIWPPCCTCSADSTRRRRICRSVSACGSADPRATNPAPRTTSVSCRTGCFCAARGHLPRVATCYVRRLLPNTARAKEQGLPSVNDLNKPGELAGYAGWLAVCLGAAAVAVTLVRPSPIRTAVTMVLITLGLAMVSYVLLQPDWMVQYRFATPVWPLAAITIALSAAHIAPETGTRRSRSGWQRWP